MLTEFSRTKMADDQSAPGELPAIGYVADLDEAQRARLAKAGEFIESGAGDYLCVQGQQHSAMSLILSGEVGITVRAHGDKVDLAVLGPGDVVGEMCVIDPRKASATARVQSGPASLWRITREAFEAFVDKHPRAGFKLMRGLAKVMCGRVRADSEKMLRREGELGSKFLDMDY